MVMSGGIALEILLQSVSCSRMRLVLVLAAVRSGVPTAVPDSESLIV